MGRRIRSNRRKGWRERFNITPEETIKQRPGLIDTQIIWAGETGPWWSRVGFDITATLEWGLDNIESSDEKPAHPSIYVACDYVAGWLATCGLLIWSSQKSAGYGTITCESSRRSIATDMSVMRDWWAT